MMNYKFWKNIIDRLFAALLLIIVFPFLFLLFLASSLDTRSFGIFQQNRIGQWGKTFSIYKLKTIEPRTQLISSFGRFLRKTKIDELPQLFNILKGEMSFVGPRPDIAGYYDVLKGEDRRLLELRPGLTSEASLKYRNEESLLASHKNPLEYNDDILFPDKVKMNLEYFDHLSLVTDFKIMWRTFWSFFK